MSVNKKSRKALKKKTIPVAEEGEEEELGEEEEEEESDEEKDKEESDADEEKDVETPAYERTNRHSDGFPSCKYIDDQARVGGNKSKQTTSPSSESSSLSTSSSSKSSSLSSSSAPKASLARIPRKSSPLSPAKVSRKSSQAKVPRAQKALQSHLSTPPAQPNKRKQRLASKK